MPVPDFPIKTLLAYSATPVTPEFRLTVTSLILEVGLRAHFGIQESGVAGVQELENLGACRGFSQGDAGPGFRIKTLLAYSATPATSLKLDVGGGFFQAAFGSSTRSNPKVMARLRRELRIWSLYLSS